MSAAVTLGLDSTQVDIYSQAALYENDIAVYDRFWFSLKYDSRMIFMLVAQKLFGAPGLFGGDLHLL